MSKVNRGVRTVQDFSIKHTLEDHWNRLDDIEKAEHRLANTQFYQMYTNGVKMAKLAEEMNKNVPEEFHMRLPTFYYVDTDDLNNDDK